MATALLVPVTFFMPPVPAIASIVTATAMAIFAGDIPSCLLRMPGTPASAAYTDEAYAMTKKGQGELALGAGLVFSVIGGLFGTAVLIAAAPALAEIALRFSSFEYFWLVVLGLASAVFLALANPLKGIVSLLAGLLVASVGLDNPAGFPRFTFGNAELAGGLTLIPIMIGMFAVSEIIRNVATIDQPWEMAQTRIGNVFNGMWQLTRRYWLSILRGSALGTAIGALPGAGADIAAWMSYAMSKRFSKEPQKFGTGHVEGIIEAGASNNSALAGAWIPAILLFCVVGSFAINNSIFGVTLMLVFGVIGYVMEENGFPVAPAILGMVLGGMLEENFISSMIKADGRLLAFFERPIAGGLGALALAVLCFPLIRRALRY